jgi:hypothetical protein
MLPDVSHNWTGNADELAQEATRLIRRLPALSDLPETNERLVRDYVRRGIVSKPHRVGREAMYQFRHLAELIAARVLVAEGWPLRMIAQTFKGATEDALLEIVEGRKPTVKELEPRHQDDVSDDDEAHAAGFMTMLPLDVPFSTTFASKGEPSQFVERATELSKVRADARAARQRLHLSEAEAPARNMVVFDIAPWAILGVESEKLERLSDEDCEDLSRAVRGALADRPERRNGKEPRRPPQPPIKPPNPKE